MSGNKHHGDSHFDDHLDIFDQMSSAPSMPDAVEQAVEVDEQLPPDPTEPPSETPGTPLPLRRTLQELLRNGLIEQSSKPQMFRQITSESARMNALLEPLDLVVRIDDVRGLAFIAVPPDFQADDGDEDEWTHALVRRQRLTLDQSLLLAILRREFLQREQESGTGTTVRLSIDSLLPQLEIYLGQTGSDMQERKRLVNLLENLRGHGVVSEIDAQENITVRPMIVHLANPENLQALLQRLREIAEGKAPTPSTANAQGDAPGEE